MSNSTGPKLLSIKHDRPGIFEVGIYIARHPISSQLATFYNDQNAPWKRLNDLVAGISFMWRRSLPDVRYYTHTAAPYDPNVIGLLGREGIFCAFLKHTPQSYTICAGFYQFRLKMHCVALPGSSLLLSEIFLQDICKQIAVHHGFHR